MIDFLFVLGVYRSLSLVRHKLSRLALTLQYSHAQKSDE